MRNLRNIKYSTWRSPPEHQERQITAAAWDLGSDSLICAYGPAENDDLIELVRVTNKKDLKTHEHNLITSWDAPCPNPNSPCDRILDLHYFNDTLTACIVLAGGDIVVFREEPTNGEDRIEIIGSVDAGIAAASWSPDEDLLAICTKADTLVYMSRTFDGITDVSMTSEDLKASNHVSVGWGKKETQFKGKGTKALRDPTVPERVDEGVLSPNDDCAVEISWRGDGAYVAVSSIEAGLRRIIRVYSREGILESVTEPVNGLEGVLSWRPSGNLIASIQRLSDRVDVVFFERNGLRHGQFTLRLPLEELSDSASNIKLAWNNDSSVLAVILSNGVQLWTMSNYHWYLKQELVTCHDSSKSFSRFLWHPEKALRFISVSTDKIAMVEYAFLVIRGSIAPPHDHGAVAVIDGTVLKITPFRSVNIPPPMALHEITVQQNIYDAAFNIDTTRIAILHRGGVAIYTWDIASKSASPPNVNNSITFLQNLVDEEQPQQICFSDGQDILVLYYSERCESLILRKYGFNKNMIRVEEKDYEFRYSSSTSMISSFSRDNSTCPFIQDASGAFLNPLLPLEQEGLTSANFPTYLPWAELITHGDITIAFGMSTNGQLYANSRLLVKNATSFLVTPSHLIFTTTTHLLKFVHITDTEDLVVPYDDPETDERCRSIERGARLVTAMPTSLSLVLQMPRGNLETIWPRAMVLAGIRLLIDEKSYQRAFAHCRTQRVDMNILYDHAPEQFIANLGLFVDQVKKVAYIDLFLSSLREDDVSQTMYKETRVIPKVENGIPFTNGTKDIHSELRSSCRSKVNYICDAFLEVLRTRTTTNLQNTITANVCKSPPALEDGLLVVAGLMRQNETLAEQAVEHICFLADVNKLYNTALGLYNLDLALLVAQQSQKDPREYLPFLQKLQEMPLLRRQFSIDDYLGRYAGALLHLYEMSQDNKVELEAYTVKHSLYKQALRIYRYQASSLDSIMGLYATHLESQSQFHEAAIAYEYLSRYAEASICYQRASPSFWRESLFCASEQMPPISRESLSSLAASLADSLTEAKDYESAASIHMSHLSSIPTAVALLCKGYNFASALHLASQHSKAYPNLLTSGGTIDTGLAEALSATTEFLAECKSQLLAQVPRIHELRFKAAADPLAFYEGELNEDLPDNISVAASSRLSTSASLFTRYTGRQSAGTAATGATRATSKNRRREERKRARGKKGTVYEEEYLFASIGRLIERVENVRGDVSRLVIGLMRRRMRERAKAVESLLAEVVDTCKEAVIEVFDKQKFLEKNRGAGSTEEAYKPVGGDAVLAESVEASKERKSAPLIGPFEKLTVLGG